jgi:uncharacterized protein (DUF983 family)
MKKAFVLLKRGLLWRCPNCGKGKVFRGLFKMNEQCPVCHFVYDRGEEGYFSGAMALNLIISELIVAAGVVPVAIIAGMNPGIPILPILVIGAALTVVLPFLFYRHSRTLWMAMDHLWHPVTQTVDDPRRQDVVTSESHSAESHSAW